MTAHDHWLNLGSDGPKELDEEAFEASIEDVADRLAEDDSADKMVLAIYNAGPALNHSLADGLFPRHLQPYIVALANLSADIRAKVDDEYQSRITTYDDPRD